MTDPSFVATSRDIALRELNRISKEIGPAHEKALRKALEGQTLSEACVFLVDLDVPDVRQVRVARP